jgi:hypothetical protein
MGSPSVTHTQAGETPRSHFSLRGGELRAERFNLLATVHYLLATVHYPLSPIPYPLSPKTQVDGE